MALNNNKRVAESIFKFTVDQSTSNQAKQRIKALEDNIKRLAKETDGFTDMTKKQQRQLKTTLTALEAYQKGVHELGRSGKLAVDQQEELEQSLRRVSRAYDDARTSARVYDEEASLARRRFSSVGDAESAGRAIGGAVGAFGGEGIERGIATAAEIPAVVEAIPILTGSIKDMGKAASQSTSFIGSMARGIGNIVPALGAVGAGFAAIGIVAVGVAAAVAPLVIGLKMLHDRSKKASEQAKILAEAIGEGASSTAEARLKLREGDIDGAIDDFNSQVREYQRLVLEWGTIQSRIVTAQEELSRVSSREFFDTSAIMEQEKLIEELQEQQDEIFNTQMGIGAGIEGMLPHLQAAGVEIEGLDQNIFHLKAVTQETADETEELTEEELALKNQRDQALSQIAALNEQEKNLIDQRAARQREEAERQALEDQFAAEDAAQRAQEHQDKLADIEADGQVKIKDIRADGITREASAVAKGEEAIAKARENANKQIADINARFMSDEIKALDTFRKEEAKRVKQANTERLRMLADLNDRLLDAERQNDVIAFIQAQKAGEKELQRQAEDATAEEKEAQASFNAEREARRQARDERIAEIRAETQERIQAQKQATRDEIAAIKEATKQRIEAQQVAIADQLEREREAERERLAREDQRAQREAQREALRESQEQRSFEAQLQRIDAKRQAELQAIAEVEAAALRLADTASSIGRSSGRTLLPTVRTPGSRGGAGSGVGGSRGYTPIAFAQGGIVKEPTLGFMGEVPGLHEAIIPFKPSEGLGGVLGGTTVHVTLAGDVVVGDVASMDQVRREVGGALNRFGNEILIGIEGARNQPEGV